ncbi:hypothetical protein [Halonatronum saccharophilum]|uniref:hypothetical protein n=1 Tax=Halonatronum saccharophilum TaxID=150060 RepID=UPI0004892C9C|nr:hypothetical protein [Halonatronum saccharophilum]
MGRHIFYLVEGLAKVIEKILVRLVVIGMVILVGVQIILTNPNLEETLIARIPRLEAVLAIGQSDDFKEDAVPVFQINNETISLKLSTYNRDRGSDFNLILNGQKVGDFSRDYIEIEVNEGDRLSIDGRESSSGIWIEISSTSKPLINLGEGKQFWVNNKYKDLGHIEVINKF